MSENLLPENLLPGKTVRCAVVEVPEISPTDAADFSAVQELLPWADPYIARLLEKHRLSEALEDSYRFVSEAESARAMAPTRYTGGNVQAAKTHYRFDLNYGSQNWSRDGE